jgi:hypothetical protein
MKEKKTGEEGGQWQYLFFANEMMNVMHIYEQKKINSNSLLEL